MSSTTSDIIVSVRDLLSEPTARFWSDAELTRYLKNGVKDLWRAIVDLKQEHYLKINNTDVSFQANSSVLSGVPDDVHKVYLIEPRDLTTSSSSGNLSFQPRDYNSELAQQARSQSAVDPQDDVIYYSITSQGATVGPPVIECSPSVTTAVNLSFAYIPTIDSLFSLGDPVPVPGDPDNALIAWTIAYARAKEREDRAPDPEWISIYGTEKASLLQSLGIRQYQEPEYVNAVWEQYW